MTNKSWFEEWEKWANDHFGIKREKVDINYTDHTVVDQILKKTEEEMMESQKFEQEQEDMGRGDQYG